MPRVIEVTTDPAWIDPIVTASAALGDTLKCNQAAVQAGALELTHPSADAVQECMTRPEFDVIISHDGTDLEGYLIVRAMSSGSYGRWVGVFKQAGQIAPIYRGMLNVAVTKYGWIRGRITNDQLRNWLEVNMPAHSIDPADPQVIRYGNVPA